MNLFVEIPVGFLAWYYTIKITWPWLKEFGRKVRQSIDEDSDHPW